MYVHKGITIVALFNVECSILIFLHAKEKPNWIVSNTNLMKGSEKENGPKNVYIYAGFFCEKIKNFLRKYLFEFNQRNTPQCPIYSFFFSAGLLFRIWLLKG